MYYKNHCKNLISHTIRVAAYPYGWALLIVSWNLFLRNICFCCLLPYEMMIILLKEIKKKTPCFSQQQIFRHLFKKNSNLFLLPRVCLAGRLGTLQKHVTFKEQSQTLTRYRIHYPMCIQDIPCIYFG